MHPKSRGTMIISEGEGRGEGVGAQVTMTRTMTYNQEDCAGGDPAVMLVPSPEVRIRLSRGSWAIIK